MAGIHAFVLLRHPGAAFHRKALSIALPLACVTALLQPLIGDLSAKHVAKAQPVKLAAMEGHYETQRGAPLRLGPVEVPGALSVLAFADPDAEVRGLNDFPKDEWPPVPKVHGAFQVMVITGSAMALLALVTLGYRWRKKAWPEGRKLTWAWLLSGPLGVVAMEAGWLVTEWGRQPWIVRGVMRTADAVTPVPHLAAPFWTFTVVYLFLGVTVVYLMVRQVAGTLPGRHGTQAGEGETHAH
jgi:cytochrome d ubiquinol oxidase subunit I